jgi:D-beta-D-heptose 7-phosphate kinase/D-beta-D-heptose 1-phosphate adenosyltransferase
VITPNQKEAALASGVEIRGESDYPAAARRLFERTGAEAILITRGPEGISLFQKGETHHHFPAEAKQVYDVTGAGDTVVAAFGAAFFSGARAEDAVRLANVAAGIQVGKLGTAVVSRSEIEHYLETRSLRGRDKIVDLPELLQRIGPLRGQKKKIVFTNGCFDLLHIGHIKYLQKAKTLGDCLIVGLNSDDSVRRLKGDNRPVIDEVERSHILAALDCVDLVVIFPEDTPLTLIRKIKPDVLVKGADYKIHEVVGHKDVLRWNGRVELVELVKGKSTTEMIRRISQLHNSTNSTDGGGPRRAGRRHREARR